MPLPFFWICLGITSVTIGAIVAYEAHLHYERFREQQDYQRYAQQYAEDHLHQPREFKESDSEDDEDKDHGNDVKDFVRHINDNSELRRRIPRSSSPPTTMEDSDASNRPVSDKSWVDETNYELNELERKLTDKKQYIERQQELLDKAEMDLERRWQLHQNRSSELLDRMSTSSYSSEHQPHDNSNDISASSSSLSMKTSTQKSTDYELSKGTIPRLSTPPLHASSAVNEHVTTTTSSTSGIQNSSLDESAADNSSSSFVSVVPSILPSNSNSIITDNNTTSASAQQTATSSMDQHQETSDSSIGLNAENPWSFEDDDDSDDDNDDTDEAALSMSFQHSMRFPTSSSNTPTTASNTHDSSDSHHPHESDWEDHSSANDILSLSSHATFSSVANSLVSPSLPSSSSSSTDNSSYDLLHGSDVEIGH
ncbi:hypothetical protein BCR42DRAFT_487675 [Absidia repens]|uniref:Uncharacterized protein n=1 Tax=Absidia repens TaxID=90262 RepID=A0A1X2ITD9_9FUNG|nr:hypothetical protein BCR42DRAFT_487675 [Absidia repens]